jgi:hypothetical protein
VVARPIDGAEGYALFLRHNGNIELDEINEYLRGIGMREVQPRMLQHYRKLQRHGYGGYITQNRLDLAVAGEHAWTADMRAQYPELRQLVAAEIIDGVTIKSVQVERLGAVSASILDSDPPPAGRVIVLRLVTTGIELLGTVSRSDRESGRFHLTFDSYSSLPVAAADSPFTSILEFALPESAESVIALSDLLLNLERSLTRIDRTGTEIVRVTRLRMSSPLQITLTGNETVDLFTTLAAAVIALRWSWYEGTKSKREAEGLQIDNEIKRRSVQSDSDKQLIEAIEAEEGEETTPLLDALTSDPTFKGAPGSMSRREFLESVKALILLPIEMTVRLRRTRRPRRGPTT